MVAGASELRDSWVETIQRDRDAEVVGTAADLTSGLALAEAHRPDIVVLHETTVGDGLVSAIPALRKAARRASVIVLAAAIDLANVERAGRAGVSGYVLEDAPTELVAAIRSAALGGIWLSPRIGAELIKDERRRMSRDGAAPSRSRGARMPPHATNR